MSRKGKKKGKKIARLSKRLRPIIEYWRQSVVDGNRLQVPDSEIDSQSVVIEQQEFERGRCNTEVLEILERRRSSEDSDDARRFQNQATLEVLIVPVRLVATDRRKPKFISPIFIPARLLENGDLLPPEFGTPWVPRDLLEPLPEGSSIALGDIDDQTAFFEKHKSGSTNDWSSYFRFCLNLFESVCEESISEFRVSGYRRTPGPIILIDPTVSGTNHIESCYDNILSERAPAGLISTLASLDKPKRRLITLSPFSLLAKAKRHVGQFENSYALSPSQRKAIHETMHLKSGEILAITGPPGTGKTTLIQSIVASMWVEAASKKAAYPPVILAASASNQAVTNIIDSFAKARTQAGPLEGRWLPEISSYGTFCVSKTKSREVSGIPIELVRGESTSGSYENWDYLNHARKSYLAKFEKYAFKTNSTEKAVSHLHRKLRSTLFDLRFSILKSQIKAYLEAGQALFKNSKNLKERFRSAYKSIVNLDIKERHTAFQLATHYWEGRWLIELQKKIEKKERLPDRGGSFKSRRHWQYLAMQTPCFVSTCSMAPRFFQFSYKFKEIPVDLLILEEAGQVSPEMGAAVFSLADRAVTCGDSKQLEPVWSVQAHTDIGNLSRLGLVKNEEDPRLQSYQRSGLLASSGSIMRRSAQVCPVDDGRSVGVFLSEHRRSVPEIVEFANTLCYGKLLEPKRASLSKRILPPFGYAHVKGIAKQSGISRINKGEAETIAAWLNEHRKQIEDQYQKSLADCVAIITPFAAQNRYLKSLLRKKYPSMTIGTVHSLQGAEREIVIFSSVYDQNHPKTMFFDRTPSMLNVSVTRAKDSFLVFGDMGIFDPTLDTPSGILANFLFRHDENELTDIEPVTGIKLPKESKRRINTLEEHSEVLIRAFREAKEEVVVVSPTVSYAAIAHDSLEPEIASAVERGVKVSVFTDDNLNRNMDEELKPMAALALQALANTGAQVCIADRIHNKGLAIDRRVIVEGSFNWLSAVRKKGARHQNLEVSLQLTGKGVREAIQDLKQDSISRVMMKVEYSPELHQSLMSNFEGPKKTVKRSGAA